MNERARGSHLSIVAKRISGEDGEIAFREPQRLPKRLDRLAVRAFGDRQGATLGAPN